MDREFGSFESANRYGLFAIMTTGRYEIGRLAQTFNSMCASIRTGREDLIRQERLSTIGRLSTSIIHDLRNPLAAIYGGAEMLVHCMEALQHRPEVIGADR